MNSDETPFPPKARSIASLKSRSCPSGRSSSVSSPCRCHACPSCREPDARLQACACSAGWRWSRHGRRAHRVGSPGRGGALIEFVAVVGEGGEGSATPPPSHADSAATPVRRGWLGHHRDPGGPDDPPHSPEVLLLVAERQCPRTTFAGRQLSDSLPRGRRCGSRSTRGATTEPISYATVSAEVACIFDAEAIADEDSADADEGPELLEPVPEAPPLPLSD